MPGKEITKGGYPLMEYVKSFEAEKAGKAYFADDHFCLYTYFFGII